MILRNFASRRFVWTQISSDLKKDINVAFSFKTAIFYLISFIPNLKLCFMIKFQSIWTRSKNVSLFFSWLKWQIAHRKLEFFLFVGPFPIHIWVLNVLVDCNYGAYHDVDCPMSTKLAEKSYRIFDYRHLTYIVNFLVLTIFRRQL